MKIDTLNVKFINFNTFYLGKSPECNILAKPTHKFQAMNIPNLLYSKGLYLLILKYVL